MNVSVAPIHETLPFVNVGVTVMIPVIGDAVVLVATKLGRPVTFPPLDDAKPIDGLSLVQV